MDLIDIKLLFKEEELHCHDSHGSVKKLSFIEIAKEAQNHSPIVGLEERANKFYIRFLDGGEWQLHLSF